MQSCCFIAFMPFSLPSPSSLLKLPINKPNNYTDLHFRSNLIDTKGTEPSVSSLEMCLSLRKINILFQRLYVGLKIGRVELQVCKQTEENLDIIQQVLIIWALPK